MKAGFFAQCHLHLHGLCTAVVSSLIGKISQDYKYWRPGAYVLTSLPPICKIHSALAVTHRGVAQPLPHLLQTEKAVRIFFFLTHWFWRLSFDPCNSFPQVLYYFVRSTSHSVEALWRSRTSWSHRGGERTTFKNENKCGMSLWKRGVWVGGGGHRMAFSKTNLTRGASTGALSEIWKQLTQHKGIKSHRKSWRWRLWLPSRTQCEVKTHSIKTT